MGVALAKNRAWCDDAGRCVMADRWMQEYVDGIIHVAATTRQFPTLREMLLRAMTEQRERCAEMLEAKAAEMRGLGYTIEASHWDECAAAIRRGGE